MAFYCWFVYQGHTQVAWEKALGLKVVVMKALPHCSVLSFSLLSWDKVAWQHKQFYKAFLCWVLNVMTFFDKKIKKRRPLLFQNRTQRSHRGSVLNMNDSSECELRKLFQLPIVIHMTMRSLPSWWLMITDFVFMTLGPAMDEAWKTMFGELCVLWNNFSLMLLMSWTPGLL